MFAKLLKLECITDLHVGNGDVNYNIIDNEVEKDSVTGYPTIHSSGIKGAFREYFVRNQIGEEEIINIFGGEKSGKTIPGSVKFMQADMLAMPARGTEGERAYYMVTSNTALKQLKDKTEMLEGYAIELKKQNNAVTGKKAEGISLNDYVEYEKKKLYIITDEDYMKLSLPVVARNKLDNGISTNLWYEEVVPHHSIFTCYVLADDEARLSEFMNVVNEKVVQFGGGATIGHGFCKISVF